MNSQIIEFQNKSFDMNQLMNVSFSFDILKSAIEFLMMNQKSQSSQIQTLEEKLKNINQVNSQRNDINSNLLNSDTLNLKRNSITLVNEFGESGIKNEKIYNNKELSNIISRIENTNKQVNDELILIKSQISDHSAEINKYSKSVEELKTKFEDINLFESFNFKSTTEEGSTQGTGGEIIQVLKSIESKIYKKIDKVNEIQVSRDEEIFKLKNESMKLKSHIEKLENLNINHTETIGDFTDRFSNLETILQNHRSLIEEKHNSNFQEIQQFINSKFEEFQTNMKTQEDNYNQRRPSSEKSISNLDSNFLEINKKINDTQKNVKILFTYQNNFDNLVGELNKLKEDLSQKANNQVVSDLKENVVKRNGLIDVLKEQLTQLSEDKKSNEELSWLRKKVEYLNSAILNVGHPAKAETQVIYPQIDLSKYTENTYFKEFQTHIQKEFESVKNILDSHKTTIDELMNQLKLKVNDKEFKYLEEYMASRFEDIKMASVKKFADKQETNKNIKYLNSEIKHIIDVYIKRMEKGDSWLIAKKPLEGFSCASCEGYIGDLNEKTTYVPWNKYPNKEHQEKYIGNGFSRMVQIMNLDSAINNKKGETTKDFFHNLPRLTNNINPVQIENSNPKDGQFKGNSTRNLPEQISKNARNINSFDINHEPDTNIFTDSQQPKIVKIYKKTRHSVDKIQENSSNY